MGMDGSQQLHQGGTTGMPAIEKRKKIQYRGSSSRNYCQWMRIGEKKF